MHRAGIYAEDERVEAGFVDYYYASSLTCNRDLRCQLIVSIYMLSNSISGIFISQSFCYIFSHKPRLIINSKSSEITEFRMNAIWEGNYIWDIMVIILFLFSCFFSVNLCCNFLWWFGMCFNITLSKNIFQNIPFYIFTILHNKRIIQCKEFVKFLWKLNTGIAGEIRWRKTIGSKLMYDSQLQQETEK